jgi:hypothetical protein
VTVEVKGVQRSPAMCAQCGWRCSELGKTTSRHHRRGLRPNPHAQGKGEVTVSLNHELVVTKSREGLTPNPRTTPVRRWPVATENQNSSSPENGKALMWLGWLKNFRSESRLPRSELGYSGLGEFERRAWCPGRAGATGVDLPKTSGQRCVTNNVTTGGH